MSPPVVTGGPLVANGGLRWVASTGMHFVKVFQEKQREKRDNSKQSISSG